MFCDKWIKTSNDAAKYRVNGVYCYNKSDFIAWLNEFIFPERKSVYVKNLGWTNPGKNLPEEYKNIPLFNF